jgi:tagaturonate reductase
LIKLNKKIYDRYKKYPVRVLQFGEGNFLRAFADWIIDKMNKECEFNTGISVVQPISFGRIKQLNAQDGLYTLYLNGIKDGKAVSEHEIINSIVRGINPYDKYEDYLKEGENPELRFIISNTTEAGIAYVESDRLNDKPQSSFPGKLTALLYHRFKYFNGDKNKGLIIIPCELIDRNGDKLKDIVVKLAKLWALEDEFIDWILNHCIFCNTLVDRIVPGYPKDKIEIIQKELGYEDDLVVVGEQFHLWVIEAPKNVKKEFPAHKIGLNVLFVDDITPYRTRKVRILNGAHTSMVPVGYLYGIDTVRESVKDEIVGNFVKGVIFEEIMSTLDLPKEDLQSFADAVIERFENPFIEHNLIDISLNSMSKYKTRVLPSLLRYQEENNSLPNRLVFSLAALIRFYKGERKGEEIKLRDTEEILELYKELWTNYDNTEEGLRNIVKKVLGYEKNWGLDLNTIDGLTDKVTEYLINIEKKGINKAILEVVK